MPWAGFRLSNLGCTAFGVSWKPTCAAMPTTAPMAATTSSGTTISAASIPIAARRFQITSIGMSPGPMSSDSEITVRMRPTALSAIAISVPTTASVEAAIATSWLLATCPSSRALRSFCSVGSSVFSSDMA